ncbi:glycoside hydrolase superfamily [Aspergillus varians]
MRPSWPTTTAALWVLPAALGASPSLCPAPCTADPSKWTPYNSMESLKNCHHPVLFDFSSHKSPGAHKAFFKILACTIDDTPESTESDSLFLNSVTTQTGLLGSTAAHDDSPSGVKQLGFLLDHIQAVLTNTSNRDTRSVVGRFNTTSVGVYSGVAVDKNLTASVIDGFKTSEYFQGRKIAAVQICGTDRDLDHTFGLAVDTTGDIMAVQHAINSWANAQCVSGDDTVLNIKDIAAIEEPMRLQSQSITTTRFTCTMETVMEGDTCADLAERCNIPDEEFMEYNSDELGEDLCSWLQPGQEVCCSERVIFEGKPQMNRDGSCGSYITRDNDTCSSIAAEHNLEESDIRYFNDGRTWGWSGCDLIHSDLKICLSDGYPPLPAPQAGATCGPTVPGTEMPMDGRTLAELNPCPLHACCNTLGNCGVSPEFCVYEEGPTGNPGTAPLDRMGCIFNCGIDIMDNSNEPTEFMRIGYYESFNLDRPCLNLRAAHIKVNDYTHIHWGFATINNTFHISVNDTHDQWSDFLVLEGVKRIITFGGWGGSANSAAYDVLRRAMDPPNVDTFILNILEFIEDNDLDGVDFDWEYPGASDAPSVVSFSLLSDGPNYLTFLRKLRKLLPHDKTISMAAPASYWHLRVFPIEHMWPHVDYIIYMTYDFHGQWDYSNPGSQDWCDGGNCLRSHVNLTETEYALSMITKAGVPRNKIAVGLASYGRVFGMTDADCTTPECKFAGPQTTAIPGVCTRTPGILAIAEIESLIIDGDINVVYYDPDSDSNILVYNETQWVAFMSKNTMRHRVEYYKSMKFAGYANWAVDLTHWNGDDDEPDEHIIDFGAGKEGIPAA